jgi:hypothetical protein
MENMEEKVSWIGKRYGQCGRKVKIEENTEEK